MKMIGFAVDDGYARIKAAQFAAPGVIATTWIPAVAKRGRLLTTADDRALGAYRVGEDASGEPVVFTVSPNLAGEAEPTRIEAYPESDLNRALVHHVLCKAGAGGQDVALATGLPMSAYFNAGAIAGKQANLQKAVVAEGGEAVANIKLHQVYPQALMAWVDHVLDATGEPIFDDVQKCKRQDLRIGVVDVGGRTTDFAVVHLDGTTPVIDRVRSGSVDLGLLEVVKRLRELILAEHKLRDLPDAMVEAALADKSLRIYGQPYDVSKQVAQAAAETASRLVTETQTKLGSAADLDRVVYVGGGAVILRDALQTYPHVFVAEAPEFSNARGMLKYMAFIDPKTAGKLAIADGAAVADLAARRASAAGA